MKRTILAPLNANFFINIHIREHKGNTNVFPIIEYATLSQDDGLVFDMEVSLHSKTQKEIIKNLLINNSYYSNAFYDEKEAEEYDLCVMQEWEDV